MEASSSKIVVANYVFLDKIGEGSLCNVFKCQHNISHNLYAMKLIDIEAINT